MNLDNVFHFGMGQQVKVQVMGVVVYGTVMRRELIQYLEGVLELSYVVKYPYGGSYSTVNPDEEFLIYVQRLKVGIQNDQLSKQT